MKKLRVAIVGCGRISVVYRDAFRALAERVEVCCAIDKVPERAAAFAADFAGCRAGERMEQLLQTQPDVVHLCTPHFLHKEQAVACLESGCHVLTEKPIALSLDDANAMMETAARCGKQLGVVFQNRYIEGVQEVKRLVAEGRFGKLRGAWSHLAWHRPPSYYECDWKGSWVKEGGGVVIDQAIHSIDLVRYWMGCEATQVQGHIARRVLNNIEVEDEADAAITFANGALYSFFACNYYQQNSPIRIELCGERGRALLTGDVVEIALEGQPPYKVVPEQGQTSGEAYWGCYHLAQLRDFYQNLVEGTAVPVNPADATKTLELVLGIYTSGKENRTVRL